MKFTNAVLARHVSSIACRASLEEHQLIQGMWNPHFCDADARDRAQDFCQDMQHHIDNIQARINLKEPTP